MRDTKSTFQDLSYDLGDNRWIGNEKQGVLRRVRYKN